MATGRRFTSTEHPGAASWPLIYGRALVGPVAACMLPVMILTLVAVLEGIRVIPYALWAAAGALAVASFWTSYQLRSRVAEIRISDGFASVQTPWDLKRGLAPEWEPVLDVRDYGSWLHVTIGLSTYELERSDWPKFADLRDALSAAAERISE